MNTNNSVKKILISQPEPTDAHSPYYRLAEKWDLKVDFRKFIQVEGISLDDFRKQGVNPEDFSAIIFTSKVAVDHFFRLLGEMRIDEMPKETKYFCVGGGYLSLPPKVYSRPQKEVVRRREEGNGSSSHNYQETHKGKISFSL